MARSPAERDVFTTGEVAKLCNVTIRTVINWFESGRLKGYKIPGSTARRIPRDSLIEFMRAHGMPLGPLERASPRKRILVVDDEPGVLELVRKYLEAQELFEVETASNGYEAGARTVAFKPDVLVIDYNLGDVTGVDVARTVRSEPGLERTRILCMSGFLRPEQVQEVLDQGIDDFIKKPIDLVDLRRRILRLLGLVEPPAAGS